MAERLETGWGPEAPEGDNLLQSVLANFSQACEHWAALRGRVERLPEVSLTDLACASMYFNVATLLRPVVRDDDPLLDEIAGFYGAGRTTPAMVWSAWPTPDLTGRGWKLIGHPPLMLLPAGAVAPEPPQGLRIDELEGDSGAAVFERILIEGFPLKELLPLRERMLMDGRALEGRFAAGRVTWPIDPRASRGPTSPTT